MFCGHFSVKKVVNRICLNIRPFMNFNILNKDNIDVLGLYWEGEKASHSHNMAFHSDLGINDETFFSVERYASTVPLFMR